MAAEIERKFLVTSDEYRHLAEPVPYRQGYIAIMIDKVVRIRTVGDKGYITVKARINDTTRKEYEYEIPLADTLAMFNEVCTNGMIEKFRYKIRYDGFVWEVDEFQGNNKGLVVAEIELTSEDQPFHKPLWVGKEVTGDPRYLNANLALNPFTKWK